MKKPIGSHHRKKPVKVPPKYTAGKMEASTRSDCLVELQPETRGGIVLTLESKVRSLYGKSIKDLTEKVCSALGVRNADIRIMDQGSLPYVIAARLEAVIRRAFPQTTSCYLPEPYKVKSLPTDRARARRTRLYLPGNEPKFFVNAGLHRPDTVILDLEDSVAPDEKDTARILVRNALRSVNFYGAERSVRINQGKLGLEDLQEIVPQHPDVILIPKCDTPEAVVEVENAVHTLEQEHGCQSETLLLPLIESALGVVNAYRIAVSSPRICAMAIGLEDYAADIGVERTVGGTESLFARMTVVNAAKAAGIQALDSVYSDIDDLEGLRQSTLDAKALGFDGKGCIHPRQIGVIHAALAPTPEEIEKAMRIVEAADESRKRGSGVVALGSKMIDAPVVLRAQRVLRLAQMHKRELR
jgi:citrate lyase subunit beta / citryl-CoA lyase